MGLQKYHTYNGGAPECAPNGSETHYGWTAHRGRHIALIKCCPCDTAPPRTAYVQGEADTFFSLPAAVRIQGRHVRGVLMRDDEGWSFTADKF